MKISELDCYTFKGLHKGLRLSEPSKLSMTERCLADDSDFCQEVVRKGLLTEEQMHRAASRFQLGKSRSGKVIYWMIDEQGIVRDGHIGTSWVSEMLKLRYPEFAEYIRPQHCLFGLHQLNEEFKMKNEKLVVKTEPTPIAIVDSEPSAVILSELYPSLLWMAPCSCFTVDLLEPLRGHRITLFPRTDPLMNTYIGWLELADQAHQDYGLVISVSSILEDHATPEQKAAKINLVEFYRHEVRVQK